MDFDKLIDDLVKLVDEFDPTAFVPELNSLLGQVELLARIAVMLGPVVLLVLGLCYLLNWLFPSLGLACVFIGMWADWICRTILNFFH